MEDIVLILPVKEHEIDANMFKEEFFNYGEKVIHGSGLLDQLDYQEWLEHTEKNRIEETAGDDWVPSTTFFAIRKEDGKIIGMIDIRHHIQHPFLSAYGGHIGYAVRPTERRKGYASKMLGLALAYAKELGLNKVMLGCDADNEGSIRTIEKCGGNLAEEKPYVDGKPMYVYWISLREQVTDGIIKRNVTNIASLIPILEEKDTSAAYKTLQELEQISDQTGELYTYTEKFADMISSDKYVIRVRGFRLFCKQAKWDKNNILDENIDAALRILKDEKPTAVRQALAALLDVVRYKPDLREIVKKAISEINYLRYKDTMHSLIAKDMQEVLSLMKEVENENI